MLKRYKAAMLASAAALTLAGCTDPTMLDRGPLAGPDRERTRQGVAIGAALGGLAGAARDADDQGERLRSAAVGAAIGGAVGAGVGALLDRQAQELRNDFDSSEISVVNTGSELLVRMPQDILFAVDSTAVRPDLQSDLRVLAQNLQRYPDSSVQVIGHTDNTGSAAYNQELSEGRARAVTSILASYGVSPSRLSAIGRGEDSPIASNLTADGRAQNRRVDIVIRPY